MRVAALCGLGLLATGCAYSPYEAAPNSPAQWQRRQEAIERREADRQAKCNQPGAATAPTCNTRPGVPT